MYIFDLKIYEILKIYNKKYIQNIIKHICNK